MDLERLKRRLYKRDKSPDIEKRWEETTSSQLGEKKEKPVLGKWGIISRGRSLLYLFQEYERRFSRVIWITAISIIAISLVLIWWGMTSFDRSSVDLRIEGPQSIASGEETVYRVIFKNRTRTDLKNMKLVFRYPDNSIPNAIESMELPDLKVGSSDSVELPVKLFGSQGEMKKAFAELSYQPNNITSRFSNQAEFETEISSVPVALDFDLSEVLASGQTFSLSLRVINKTVVPVDSLKLRLSYPEGFSFKSSVPQAIEKDNVWVINNLSSYEEREIIVTGSIQGGEGEVKTFRAEAGRESDEFHPYLSMTDSARISLSPLSVSQTLNGATNYAVQAGDKLSYRIAYENTTDVGIRNVVITSKLEGSAFNLKRLEPKGGSFNGADNTITWKASNLPELLYLDPHESGEIEFSIEIKDPLPVTDYTDKNLMVSNTVEINSSEIPPALQGVDISGESQLTSKVISQFIVQAKGYYYDNTLPNSGPVPPVLGQRTTYTIRWQLVNYSNDLNNVLVECDLPPYVEWVGSFVPSNENLQYHHQTGRLTWDIGRLLAGTGVVMPVKEVVFQVAVVPSIVQLGSDVLLTGKTKASADDEFVGMGIYVSDDEISTDMPDDPKVSSGRVVE